MTARIARTQRVRQLALATGVMLGLVAGTLAPQLARASNIKPAKTRPAIVEKLASIPEASAEQLQAAERVLVGHYDCEFGKKVSISPNETYKGYFNLNLGSQSWLMKPVLSSTGATRLEDVRGAALMIQILTKSMLMDPKSGHRLVDGCRHDVQRAAQDELDRHPQASVFNLNN